MLDEETVGADAAETPQDAPIKRGRGRPPGSLNKVRPPTLSPQEVEALKRELAPLYVAALAARARAEVRARGLKTMISSKLGRDVLASIEAEVVVDVDSEVGERLLVDRRAAMENSAKTVPN